MSDTETAGETSRDVTVQGHRRDANTIFLKLRIADSEGWCLLFLLFGFFAYIRIGNSQNLAFCKF